MADITASMVKELRDRTQAGMSDCKQALVEAAGDLDKAVEVIPQERARQGGRQGRTSCRGRRDRDVDCS